MRRYRAPLCGPDIFFAAPSWAGYITNMSGFDLRQGQAGQEALKPAGRSFDDPAIPGAVRLHRIAK